MMDHERGAEKNDIFELQLERGKSFQEITKQKLFLEEKIVKVTQEDITRMRTKLLIGKKDFVLLEILVKKQKGKLGNIHKATLKGEEVICKVIELERINNFLIEGFLEFQCRIE